MTNKKSHIRYLLTTEQDAKWGLVITTAGHQDIPAGTPYPSSDHPVRYLFSTEKGRVLSEYQLVYISRGRGRFVSSHQKETKINEGYMFLLFPGEWHNYTPDPETGWHESWIGFTGVNMDNRVQGGFFPLEKPVFNTGVHDSILQLYRSAAEVAREQQTGYQQMLAGIANYLLGFAYSEDRQLSFEDMKVANNINKAKILMLDNLDGGIPCENIAASIGMGYSWFRKIFKEYTGFSPAQYMLELRIGRVKELLTNTALTCQEIAYAVGFETPSHFNSIFKKKTGLTPRDYRRMTQGGDLKF